MNDPKKEIESSLIQELIGDNVVVIIHEDGGITVMLQNEEDLTADQYRTFSRVYCCVQPSFVLRFFFLIEINLFILMESLEDLYKKWFK